MAQIVVVEDDYGIAELLTVVLTEQGHRVRWAYDGETALALIRAQPPDLLITDLMLPGLSGWQLLSALAAEPGLAAIPVLVVSVLEEPHARLPAGVRYLRKPVSLEELDGAIQQLLPARPAGAEPDPR